MTKFIQQKFQETYYWHHQIHESNQRDFYGTQKPFSFSPSNAPRKSEGQKFFLTKTRSKKFHNSNQQQQQQRHTYHKQTGSQQQRYGTYNYSTTNIPEHGFNSRKTNAVGIKKGSAMIKKLLSKTIPDVPFAGRLKHFVGAYIPYRHFKIEDLQNLKYMLQKGITCVN